MDLIGSLAGALGVEPRMAEAVAGAVLGATRDQAPEEETAKLDEAIPEISGWKDTAKMVLAEASDDDDPPDNLFESLTEMAGSGIGNQLIGALGGAKAQNSAAAVALIGKLGLEPSHAAMIAPVVLQFVEARIGSEWLQRLLSAAPMLAGMQQAGASGGKSGAAGALGGMLGGLFGKK